MMCLSRTKEKKNFPYLKESTRIGAKVTTQSTYLGKMVDRELKVFFRSERGFCTYDVESRQYDDPPSTFCYPS